MSAGVQTPLTLRHIVALRPMTLLGEQHVLHVLVVENDRMVCRLILRREGWNVTCVPDGHPALEVLRTNLPDVLLLDIRRPDTSKFDVLDWIEKTNPPWLPHVIGFTAASSEAIAGLERERRIWGILRKPFNITELVNGIALCAADTGTGRGRRPANERQALPC